MRHRNMMNGRIAVLAVTALLMGAAAPASADGGKGGEERLAFTQSIDLTRPSGGSGWSVQESCESGSCRERLVLGAGGYVHYDVDLLTIVDKLKLRTRGATDADSCRYGLESLALGTGHGTVTGDCPGSTSEAAAAWYGVFFDAMFDTLRFTVTCDAGCDGTVIEELTVEAYFRELTLDVGEPRAETRSVGDVLAGGGYVTQTCITVKASGSPLYGAWLRIDWGDGERDETHWPVSWSNTQAEQEFCHSYAPTAGSYLITVTLTDRLARALAEHREASWI